MAQPARVTRISRRSWLLAGLAVPLFRARAADSIDVTYDGDNLHVSAPALHFLAGKPLDRLKDASTVVFLSQLTLFAGNRDAPFRKVPDRFVVSYDLWEEKFSVTQLGTTPRSTPRLLSAAAAETWCLEGLAISSMGLVPDRVFWLRLEMRTADANEVSSGVSGPGLSLSDLIGIFARKSAADQTHWTLESRALRLADLARTPGRGTRIG
jgi:hypothetical protein